MKIIFKNKVLVNRVKICDDSFSKSKGLMFSKKLKKNEALLFIFDNESISDTSIHMFFVFFSIDVIWLDKNKKIVDLRRNVKSFTPLIIPKKPAKYILELSEGISKDIKIGDSLKF